MKKNRNKTVWLLILLLVICIAMTMFTLMNRLNLFMDNEKGAIELAPQNTENKIEQNDVKGYAPNYSFEVTDGKKVWKTDTEIEIFCISYENGETKITAESSTGEKIITPGTENQYIFKLKNTGNAALDYKMTISGYSTPEDIEIPIMFKVSRYDNKYIIGNRNYYDSTDEFKTATDSATLAPGRYTYYTLDWIWPFETGKDEYDTFLGNLSTKEKVSYTITIETIADASDDENGSGILIPQTGDDSALSLYVILSVISIMLPIVAIFGKRKK